MRRSSSRFVAVALLAALIAGGRARAEDHPIGRDPIEEMTESATLSARRGDFDAARATLDRAIRLQPDRAETYLLRGRIRLQGLGDKADLALLKRNRDALVDGTADADYWNYPAVAHALEDAMLDHARFADLAPRSPDAAEARAKEVELREMTQVARECAAAYDRREQQRLTQVHDARRRAEEVRKEAEIREEEEWTRHRDRVALRRRIGWVLVGAGCAGLAAAGIFSVLGLVENNDIASTIVSQGITSSQFATRADIQGALDVGQQYNVAAWTSLGVGAAVVATGALLAAFNLDPGASRVSIAPMVGRAFGLAATLSFQ